MTLRRFVQLICVLFLAIAIWLGTGSSQITAAQTIRCPGGFSSWLSIGDRAEVTPGPSSTLWSNWQTDKVELEILSPGSTVTILDGPECRNNITWWKVRSHKNGKIGWLGEGRVGSGYWLQKVELPDDSVWGYGIVLGTNDEMILYDSTISASCERFLVWQDRLVRGDQIQLYQLDESQQLVKVVDSSKFWLFLDESRTEKVVGLAFEAAQLTSICPRFALELTMVEPRSIGSALVLRRHTVEVPDVPSKTSFDIQVPRFEVLSSLEGLDGFNTLVDDIVTREVEDFITLMQESFTLDGWNPERSRDSYLKMDYYIIGQTDGIVSLLIVRNSDIWYAAHPVGESNYSVNYDLVNDSTITLDDLFLPNSDYYSVLLRLIDERIDLGQHIVDLNIDDLLSSWNIGPSGLLLSFDTGEVTANAAGPVRILIPYSALVDLLNEDGPVEKLRVPAIHWP